MKVWVEAWEAATVMYRNNDGSPLEVPESALFRPAVDHTVLRHSAKDYGDSAKQFHLGFQDGDWWRHGCSGGTTWEEVAAVTRIVDQFDSGRHHRSKATDMGARRFKY